MMLSEVVLIRDSEGNLTLGLASILGVIPVISFSSGEELRRFAMGLLGYCEQFYPEAEMPNVFKDFIKSLEGDVDDKSS